MSNKTGRANLFTEPLVQGTGPAWEPWRPKVGDRVRVRFSSECAIANTPKSKSYRSGSTTGHHAEMNAQGKTGIIEDPWGKADKWLAGSHHYYVRMDESFEVAGATFKCVAAAAIELEPIQEPGEDGGLQ